MGTGAVPDREAITAALDPFEAAQAELAALSFDALTGPEVLTVKDRLETDRPAKASARQVNKHGPGRDGGDDIVHRTGRT